MLQSLTASRLPSITNYWRKMEKTERHGRRCKQLKDGLKEKRRYWNLNEKALDCPLWRTHFERSCGPVSRQTIINEPWLT
jgi:hypothetical protein